MKLLKTLISIGAISAISTLTTVATAQESIARIRFTWNFSEPGGAIYMNICTDPDFNIDAQSGGASQMCKNKERNIIRDESSRIIKGLNLVALPLLAQTQN